MSESTTSLVETHNHFMQIGLEPGAYEDWIEVLKYGQQVGNETLIKNLEALDQLAKNGGILSKRKVG